MLIEYNVTPLISGRHSGGGGTAATVMDPGSQDGLTIQLQNMAQRQDQNLGQEQEPRVVPGSMEHQIQERLLITDKRLRQAMFNTF